jgi:hypothetical protein
MAGYLVNLIPYVAWEIFTGLKGFSVIGDGADIVLVGLVCVVTADIFSHFWAKRG